MTEELSTVQEGSFYLQMHYFRVNPQTGDTITLDKAIHSMRLSTNPGLLWEIPGGISRLGNTVLSITPQVGNTGKYWEILILDFNICV